MAQKIKGITIEIGGDVTNLDKALGEVNSKTKDLKNELKGVNSLLKLDPSNVTLLKQKQDILNQSIATTRDKLNTLKNAQVQVQEQFDKGKITEEQFRDFQREIINTENKLKSLTDELEKFGSVGSQRIIATGKSIQNAGNNIESVGKKVSIASVAASAALIGVSKSSMDFETAWAGVTKTINGSDAQLEQIKQGILDLAKATSSSSSEIAGVAEAAGQLGVKTENILAFTETMVRLGDSTNMSAEEAASAIAQLYNVMGDDINTVDRFGSAIVALGNNAATTESDIVNMASRIASSGKQVGLTSQEVLALSTTLASVGLEAEGGGSAISAVITKIDKDVALGTNDLKVWANVAGMSVKSFKNLWENDAMSAIQKVVAGMGDAKAGGENLNIILDDLGVTSLRQTDTMKRLSSAAGLMTNMVDLSNVAWQENTALTEESSKRYETSESKVIQLKNTISEFAIKLGDILLPIIKKIIDGLSSFVNWLSNLDPAIQTVIVTILAIVAALGPLLISVGNVISAIGTITTIIPTVISIVKTVTTAFSAFNAVLLANPIALVVAAIAALVAGFIYLWNNCEEFRNFWINLWENIKNVCKSVIDGIIGFFNGVIDFIKNNWQSLLLFIVNPFAGAFKLLYDNCEAFKNFIDNIIAKIKAIFESIVGFIDQNVIEPVKTIFTSAWNFIKDKALDAWESIKNIFSPVVQWFTDLFTSIYNSLMSIINVIWGLIQGTWTTIKLLFEEALNWINESIIEPVKNAFFEAWNFIKDTAISVWENIKNTFSEIVGWFTELFTSIYNSLMSIIDVIWGLIQGTWTTIKLLFDEAVNWIKNSVIEPIKNFIFSAIDAIKNAIQSAWDFIVNVFIGMANWIDQNVIVPIKNILSSAWSWVQNSIILPIKNTFTEAWNFIKNGASSAWEGIKNVFSSVASFFENTFSKAWNKVKSIFSTGGQIFSGIKDGIVDSFKKIVNGLIDGINKVISTPFNAINGMLNKIRNASVLGVKPFSKFWSNNPLSVPQIPKLRTGGTIIGDGEAIMAEAGPELITMLNGKAQVRPLTNTDRKEIISNTNNSGNNTFNFYSPKALTPSECVRSMRKEIQYQKLIHG